MKRCFTEEQIIGYDFIVGGSDVLPPRDAAVAHLANLA